SAAPAPDRGSSRSEPRALPRPPPRPARRAPRAAPGSCRRCRLSVSAARSDPSPADASPSAQVPADLKIRRDDATLVEPGPERAVQGDEDPEVHEHAVVVEHEVRLHRDLGEVLIPRAEAVRDDGLERPASAQAELRLPLDLEARYQSPLDFPPIGGRH